MLSALLADDELGSDVWNDAGELEHEGQGAVVVLHVANTSPDQHLAEEIRHDDDPNEQGTWSVSRPQ